ncbi:MAG: NAD(P)H-dependent oxidoreductase [Shimia sp.]|uniref:NAD(P)H-dependent oxidoreductase n=1 Tax=Shimia sp. TaxID=1954381 RepID=UPI0040584F35
MGTVLVVSGHPSERSFTNAWAEASCEAARMAGHEVLRSDLCAMGFDAVERAAHYGASGGGVFDPLKAQEAAGQAGELPLDVAGEVAKVQAADRIILHFPIWWFAPPAVIKGWCDRVLVQGVLHAVDQRFDAGMCRDTSVLFCVSTGASEAECGPDGKEGDLALQLWPLAQTFRYLGMRVLAPKTVHGVHGYHEGDAETALRAKLGQLIAAQTDVIAAWDTQPQITFNSDGDFDDAGRLKPGVPSYSAFVRHP